MKNVTPEQLSVVFQGRLMDLMNEKDLKQADLARELEVSRQAVYRWYNDGILPDIKTLCRIAELFDTSTDYLLGRSDTPIKADKLQITLSEINARVIDRINELKAGEADAGLRFINTLLDKNDFYKALVYLNTACRVQRLKEIEPSTQSSAYMLAVKVTNAAESTKEVIVSGNSAVEYYTDKATKVIGEIFKDIVEGKEV